MHQLEPYYGWQDLYRSESDPKSPFFGRVYSEFEFTNQIYNYAIHPQWDEFGSSTLLIKILFINYGKGFMICELLGEWNDCLYNDIMLLKREVIDPMTERGICKFILIGENVLNFHASDDCYYEEWFEDVYEKDGWIALLSFRTHVVREMEAAGIDQYVAFAADRDDKDWRTYEPDQLFTRIDQWFQKRIG